MSKLGQDIINYINSHAKYTLPKEGIIAGQCVAEAYFRVLNIPIFTRIKDIDIFTASNHNKNTEYNKDDKFVKYGISYAETIIKYKQKKREESNNSYGDEFSNILSDSLNFKETIYDTTKHYNIKYVFELENLNIINIKEEARSSRKFTKIIVDAFDINMVKIGVCLKTGYLYISEDFKTFLKKKQLEVNNFKTPFKSLVRYSNKGYTSNGFYSDFNYALNLMYPLFVFKKDTLKSVSIESLNGLCEKSKKEISKYFKLSSKKHTIVKKVVIPLNLKRKSKIDLQKISTVNYKLNKAINENQYIYLQTPKFDYLSSHNPYSNKDIIDDVKKHYILDKVKDYITNFQKKDIPKVVQKIRAKYNPQWNKNKIVIWTVKEFETVYYEPKARVFDKTVKENIKTLAKAKPIRESLEKVDLLRHREFLEIFFSTKKVKIFVNFLYNKTKIVNCESKIKIIEKLLRNKHNSLNQILQLRKDYFATFVRHFKLFEAIHDLSVLKDIPFPLKDIAEKILYLENFDESFIGLFEARFIPSSLFLTETNDFKDEILKINHKRNKNIEKLKEKDFIKLDENMLLYKDYKITQIYNPYRLKEVGKEMNHCVGGYSPRLSRKEMLFFDVYNPKKERRTLSVWLDKDVIVQRKDSTNNPVEKFHGIDLVFDQYKGKRNLEPKLKEMQEIVNFVNILHNRINESIYRKDDYLIKELEIA